MAAEKRLAYNTEFKLKAIDYAKEHGNRPAAREFSINECMVRRWRQQEEELRLTRKTKKSFRGHKARRPELEDGLYHWISEQRAAGRSLSTVTIRIQAKAIANQLHIEEFKAGPSWCFHFMKQRQLSIRTRTTVCQQLLTDYKEKLAAFWSYCKSKISEKNIQPHCIINMDKVPLTFDMPLTRSVEHTGTPTVPIRTTGNKKTSFTVVLGISSDGQKLHPMVIFKRKTLPKDKFPKGIKVEVNPKGWMDEEVMRTWLTEVYAGRPGGFFHSLLGLLIFDSMCTHKTESVKAMVKKMNSELAVIPGGLTKEVQPLDIGIIHSFKAKMRLLWETWMVEGEHSYTNTGRLHRASYATVCQWILDAWGKVTTTAIIRGFAKADIIPGLTSNAIKSTEIDNSDGEDTGDTGSGLLDTPIAQLLISDTEDEGFEGFMEDEATDEAADERKMKLFKSLIKTSTLPTHRKCGLYSMRNCSSIPCTNFPTLFHEHFS
uniref:HTH CENPB-type domain-containing protein n=1 Tax=Catharus ustulatus TaxID=91951 RepID=A0A8C3TJ34_CATUS